MVTDKIYPECRKSDKASEDRIEHLAQLLYLVTYSLSLVSVTTVFIFRKKLAEGPGRRLKSVALTAAFTGSLISLQVFWGASGAFDAFDDAQRSRIALYANSLIMAGIGTFISSAASVSFAFVPSAHEKAFRAAVRSAVGFFLIFAVALQVAFILFRDGRAIAVAEFFLYACVLLYVFFIGYSLYRLRNVAAPIQPGILEFRVLLIFLLAFPVVFLAFGQTVGSFLGPSGLAVLNVLCIRILAVLIAAGQSLPARRAEPAASAYGESNPLEICEKAGLSKREGEVAVLLSRGKTYKEIASELFISVSTTQTHVGRIYAKFGINSKTELANILYSR